MKKLFIFLIFSVNVVVNFRGLCQNFGSDCVYAALPDSSVQGKQLFKELSKLNCASLGDSGESSDSKQYLSKYVKIIEKFDLVFEDSVLIEIITKNECPLVSCYAFTALLYQGNKRISDKTVARLILPFAKDSTTLISIDHGCYQRETNIFYYLFMIAAGSPVLHFLPGLIPVGDPELDLIQDERINYMKGNTSGR